MNYAPPPPLPSATRLARLTLWLALTTAWFAAHVLALFAPDAAKRRLAKYARWGQCVLIVRAMRRTPGLNVKWRKHTLTRARCLTLRRMGGGALRRAFSGRSPAERARAIYAILTDPERWIAHVVRRLARRFSKLRALPRPALVLEGASLALSPNPRAPDSS